MSEQELPNHKQKLLIAAITLIIIVSVAVGIFLYISSQPIYTGKGMKLSQPDSKTSLQMGTFILSGLPAVGNGVQSSIKITKFTGNFAQGSVTYSNKSPTQQYMAMKDGDKWKVITHNAGNMLNLPDIKTAKQYQLPRGWFKS